MCKVHAIRKQINMMILVAHWTRRGGHVRDNIVCVCACNTCSRENDSTRRARPFNLPIRFKCAHSHRSAIPQHRESESVRTRKLHHTWRACVEKALRFTGGRARHRVRPSCSSGWSGCARWKCRLTNTHPTNTHDAHCPSVITAAASALCKSALTCVPPKAHSLASVPACSSAPH